MKTIAYYTVLIPPVADASDRTEWHPSGPSGGGLSRGAFLSEHHAIVWARAHLNGTPYSIRQVDENGDLLPTT